MTLFGVLLLIIVPIILVLFLYLLAGWFAARWVNKKTQGKQIDWYYEPNEDYSRRSGYRLPADRGPGQMFAINLFWPVYVPYVKYKHRNKANLAKIWGM